MLGSVALGVCLDDATTQAWVPRGCVRVAPLSAVVLREPSLTALRCAGAARCVCLRGTRSTGELASLECGFIHAGLHVGDGSNRPTPLFSVLCHINAHNPLKVPELA